MIRTLPNPSAVLKYLLLIVVLVPAIEIAVIYKLGVWIGLVPTLLLMFGAGLIGAVIARVQGFRAALSVRSQLMHGVMPAATVVDGLLIALAGGLLVLPGFLSDIAGIALLFPATRALVRRGVVRWLQQRFRLTQFGGRPDDAGDRIVDARVVSSRIID